MTTTASHQTAELDLDKLEALAKAATPGPWKRHADLPTDVIVAPSAPSAPSVAVIDHGPSDLAQIEANGRFIAAANPATVLALIAQARATGTQGASELARLLELAAEAFSDAGASVQHGAGTADVPEWAQLVVKLFANETRAQLALQRKGEPVAVIIDGNGGANSGSLPPKPIPMWIGDLPEIGTKLYAAPQASREVPEGDLDVFKYAYDKAKQSMGETVAMLRRDLYAAPSPASAEDGEKREILEGWAIEEVDGELRVKKDGQTGIVPRCGGESLAECILFDLASDLLAAQLDGSQKAGGAE